MALFGSAKVLTVGSFTAIGVGVGGAVAVSQKGNSEEKSRTQSLSPAKEIVSTSESTPQPPPPPSPEEASISKSCSIVQINGPNKAGSLISKVDQSFDLETLKTQPNVMSSGKFYEDVTGACNGNPGKSGVDSLNVRIVYVTYSGTSGNYSLKYQKDWESKKWIQE